MGKYGKLPCALIDNKMFPSVEVDCGSFVVACPCCGSQIPCLDIRFIDACDRLSDEVRKRTGVHMPVYQEKCPVRRRRRGIGDAEELAVKASLSL